MRDRLRGEERAVPGPGHRDRRAAAKIRPAERRRRCRAEPLSDGRTVQASIESSNARHRREARAAAAWSSSTARSATYLHRRASDLPPQIGVLVAFEGDDDAAAEAPAECHAGRRHAGPQYSRVTRCRLTWSRASGGSPRRSPREEGKPEQALPKIIEGRVNGFFKDVVLLEQASVRDPKQTVKACSTRPVSTVTDFARFEVGA